MKYINRLFRFFKLWWVDELRDIFIGLFIGGLSGIIGVVIFLAITTIPYTIISLYIPSFLNNFSSSMEFFKYCGEIIVGVVGFGSVGVIITYLIYFMICGIVKAWNKSKIY